MFHVKQSKLKYPDARHHCWAYVVGDPNNTTSAGFDDDGEPSGTAGKPILSVLQHKAIGDVVVIVTRYFGGIKLGAGGLTRAYASTAQAVVDAASKQNVLTPFVATTTLQVRTDFASESQLRYVIKTLNGIVHTATYTQFVILTVQLPTDQVAQLKDNLGADAKLIDTPKTHSHRTTNYL